MDDETKQEGERPVTRRDLFAAAALFGAIAAGRDDAATNCLNARAYADTMIAVLDGHHDASEAQS